MLNEPRTIKGTELCLSQFSSKKGDGIMLNPPLLILLPLVSDVDRFLGSFPDQTSSSSVIERGCKPVIRLLVYICVLYIYRATGVKHKARNYITIVDKGAKLSGVHNRTGQNMIHV